MGADGGGGSLKNSNYGHNSLSILDLERFRTVTLKRSIMNEYKCYVIWLFVKCLSQEAIQRRSQLDRLVKIKVFKLRRDADDIPCNITFRSAGGGHSIVQDPPQQRPDSGIEKYGTKA